MSKLIAKIRGSIYRLKYTLFNKNIKIGKGLKLYCKLQIKGNGKIILGKRCSVRKIPGSRNQFVTLYTHSPNALLRIGDNVQLVSAKISCKYSISIGSNVVIEDSSILDTDFHSIDIERGAPIGESKETCEVNIGEGVLISAGSFIAKGVTIEEGSMVGPRAVVNQSFAAKSIIFGNPAKLIKSIN